MPSFETPRQSSDIIGRHTEAMQALDGFSGITPDVSLAINEVRDRYLAGELVIAPSCFTHYPGIDYHALTVMALAQGGFTGRSKLVQFYAIEPVINDDIRTPLSGELGINNERIETITSSLKVSEFGDLSLPVMLNARGIADFPEELAGKTIPAGRLFLRNPAGQLTGDALAEVHKYNGGCNTLLYSSGANGEEPDCILVPVSEYLTPRHEIQPNVAFFSSNGQKTPEHRESILRQLNRHKPSEFLHSLSIDQLLNVIAGKHYFYSLTEPLPFLSEYSSWIKSQVLSIPSSELGRFNDNPAGYMADPVSTKCYSTHEHAPSQFLDPGSNWGIALEIISARNRQYDPSLLPVAVLCEVHRPAVKTG